MEWLSDQGEEPEALQICFETIINLEFKLMLASQRPDRPYEIFELISQFSHLYSRLRLIVSNGESEAGQIKLLSERVLFYLGILDSVRLGYTNLESVVKPEDLLSEDVAMMFIEDDYMEVDECEISDIREEGVNGQLNFDDCHSSSNQTLHLEDNEQPNIMTLNRSDIVTHSKSKLEISETIEDMKPVYSGCQINFTYIYAPLTTHFSIMKQDSTRGDDGSGFFTYKISLLDNQIDEFITGIGEFGILKYIDVDKDQNSAISNWDFSLKIKMFNQLRILLIRGSVGGVSFRISYLFFWGSRT